MFETLKSFLVRPEREILLVAHDGALGPLSEILDGVPLRALPPGSEALGALDEKPYRCLLLAPALDDEESVSTSEELLRLSASRAIPVLAWLPETRSSADEEAVRRLAQAGPFRPVSSHERLLDQSALFLHHSLRDLPEEKRRLIEGLYANDSALAGRTVLIVDDDIRNIFAMTSVLERHDMRVLSAETGREAIATLETKEGIDVVLMDIMMPDMDGYDTMRAIRKVPRLRSLPIIAVTAKAMKGDREKTLEAGAWDYLAKPVDADNMLSVLRAWLHR